MNTSILDPELHIAQSGKGRTSEIISSTVGISAIVLAFQGYLFRGLQTAERVAFLTAGILLVYPHWIRDLIGYMVFALLLLYNFLSARGGRSAFSVGSERAT